LCGKDTVSTDDVDRFQIDDKTIVESRLLPRFATYDEYLLVFVFENNLISISAVMLVAFYHRSGTHVTRHGAIM